VRKNRRLYKTKGAPMDLRRNLSRNREIFARFQAGQTVKGLSLQFDLSVARVRVLLTDEKNRHTVSPEPFYRALRGI
jgi:hypothetical protein